MAERIEAKVRQDQRNLYQRQTERIASIREAERMSFSEAEQRDAAERAADRIVKSWSTGKNTKMLLKTLASVVPAALKSSAQEVTDALNKDLQNIQREQGTASISEVQEAELSAIRRAFRRAARVIHPDKLSNLGSVLTTTDRFVCSKVFDQIHSQLNK